VIEETPQLFVSPRSSPQGANFLMYVPPSGEVEQTKVQKFIFATLDFIACRVTLVDSMKFKLP
jgi:hypothetical protein